MNEVKQEAPEVHLECDLRYLKYTASKDFPELGIVAGQRFHLRLVRKCTYKVQAQVTIKRSVALNGTVTALVRTNEGHEYTVVLRRDQRHSCTCPKRGECYHIDIRRYEENSAATQRVQAQVPQPQEPQAKPEMEPVVIRMEKAPLNGNGGFSLLKQDLPRKVKAA